ncbi:MAG: hypothetical protein QNJ38_23285, partial [Prochloraceae cyanobacterium]|nr:hypothetical protein [Prochloraceae cyanobacterium]
MFKISQPPSPPENSEVIFRQVQSYYQELVAYHQDSLAIAQKKLAALEHFLELDTDETQINDRFDCDLLTIPVKNSTEIEKLTEKRRQQQLNCPQTKNFSNQIETNGNGNGNGIKASNSKQLSLLDGDSPQCIKTKAIPAEGIEIKSEDRQLISQETEISGTPREANFCGADRPWDLKNAEIESVEIDLSFASLAPKITGIFQANSGTILQLDYLLRKIIGKAELDSMEQLKSQLREVLVKGEAEKLWDKVPETPNCWTLDVSLLPDFQANQSQIDLSKIKHNSNRETLLGAIAIVLKDAWPKQLTSKEIARAIAPNVTKRKPKACLSKRVQNLLPRWGHRFGWHKVATGVYVWNESESTNSQQQGNSAQLENSQQETADLNHLINIEELNLKEEQLINSSQKQSQQTASEKSDWDRIPTQPLGVHAKGEEILKAIDRLLKEAAPKAMSSKEIVAKLIGTDTNDKQEKYFCKRVQSLLPNWAGNYGWQKLSQGVYRLKGDRNDRNGDKQLSQLNCQSDSSELDLAKQDCSDRGGDPLRDNLKQNDSLQVEDSQTSSGDRSLVVQTQSHSIQLKPIKNLPAAPKLLSYGTVVATITACLEALAPDPVTISQILDWLYPE